MKMARLFCAGRRIRMERRAKSGRAQWLRSLARPLIRAPSVVLHTVGYSPTAFSDTIEETPRNMFPRIASSVLIILSAICLLAAVPYGSAAPSSEDLTFFHLTPRSPRTLDVERPHGRSNCRYSQKENRIGHKWHKVELYLDISEFDVEGRNSADAVDKLADAILSECRKPHWGHHIVGAGTLNYQKGDGHWRLHFNVDQKDCVEAVMDCLHKHGPGAVACVSKP